MKEETKKKTIIGLMIFGAILIILGLAIETALSITLNQLYFRYKSASTITDSNLRTQLQQDIMWKILYYEDVKPAYYDPISYFLIIQA